MIVNTFSDNFLKNLAFITLCYYHIDKGGGTVFRVELKKHREGAGLSQYKLAEKMGVSQATVGMWESGKREPNFTMLCKLADFFGVSVDALIGKKEKAPTQEGERKRINTITIAGRDGSYVVKQLTDEQLQAFKTMFEHLPQVEDDL